MLVRGDHEVNDIKLKNLYQCWDCELAEAEETIKVLGCSVGSLGPVAVSGVEVIADHAVKAIVNGVCGANEEDYHFINVNPERDFSVSIAMKIFVLFKKEILLQMDKEIFYLPKELKWVMSLSLVHAIVKR